MPNEPLEAYTGNCAGRRESRSFPKQSSLVTQTKQVATVWVNRKPAQRDRKRRDLGGPVGVIKRGMYREWNCELGRPLELLHSAGRNRQAKVSRSRCFRGVRPPHSTSRRESRSHGEGGGSVA